MAGLVVRSVVFLPTMLDVLREIDRIRRELVLIYSVDVVYNEKYQDWLVEIEYFGGMEA